MCSEGGAGSSHRDKATVTDRDCETGLTEGDTRYLRGKRERAGWCVVTGGGATARVKALELKRRRGEAERQKANVAVKLRTAKRSESTAPGWEGVSSTHAASQK